MNRYLIIADDFTGANDTGVQMKRRGLPTTVIFAGHPVPAGEGSVVIDTESRGLTGPEAGAATAKSLEGVDLDGFKCVIKKVDSTLRGNVAEEILAADRAFGSELVIFAPALPALGRTTEGGVHMLKGVPICQTELARDPKKPVREDNLKRILEQVYDEPVTHVGLETIRSGNISLEGGRLFTFDATLDGDLRAVILAAKATGKRVLWVGTAAIADSLMELEKRTDPVLCAVASVSSVTREQVREAEKAGVTLIQVPIHELLAGREQPDRYEALTADRLLAGHDTVLLSSSSYDREQLALSEAEGKKKGMETSQVSEYVQALMGSMTVNILKKAPVSGLFLTGGDTAMGVLGTARADGSEILSEILVGIPMMKIVGGALNGTKVVTKAGAFGKEDAILFAIRKLKEA